MAEAGSAYCNDMNNVWNSDYNDRCVAQQLNELFEQGASAVQTMLIVYVIVVAVVVIGCIICCVCLCKYMAKANKNKKSDSDKKEGGIVEITEV